MFDAAAFKRRYVAAGGSRNSANSYVSYLSRFDLCCGGVDEVLADRGGAALLAWGAAQPDRIFGGSRQRRDSMAAARKYVELTERAPTTPAAPVVSAPTTVAAPGSAHLPAAAAPRAADALRSMLDEARSLGTRYHALTGKPLGVTGEVAELAAAETLGVELALARQAGFDGWLTRDAERLRVQIKGRAVVPERRYVGRCPSIKGGRVFDICLLVLLDRATLATLEIWEADEAAIEARIAVSGSKARNERRSLGISQFKSIARRVWPT